MKKILIIAILAMNLSLLMGEDRVIIYTIDLGQSHFYGNASLTITFSEPPQIVLNFEGQTLEQEGFIDDSEDFNIRLFPSTDLGEFMGIYLQYDEHTDLLAGSYMIQQGQGMASGLMRGYLVEDSAAESE